MVDLSTPQPPPQPNDGPSMHDLVCQDIQDRKVFGLVKYGTILQAFNGRDGLVDAFQEGIDLLVYLRKVIEERRVLFEFVEQAAILMAGLRRSVNARYDIDLQWAIDLATKMAPLLDQVRKMFPRVQ